MCVGVGGGINEDNVVSILVAYNEELKEGVTHDRLDLLFD